MLCRESSATPLVVPRACLPTFLRSISTASVACAYRLVTGLFIPSISVRVGIRPVDFATLAEKHDSRTVPHDGFRHQVDEFERRGSVTLRRVRTRQVAVEQVAVDLGA